MNLERLKELSWASKKKIRACLAEISERKWEVYRYCIHLLGLRTGDHWGRLTYSTAHMQTGRSIRPSSTVLTARPHRLTVEQSVRASCSVLNNQYYRWPMMDEGRGHWPLIRTRTAGKMIYLAEYSHLQVCLTAIYRQVLAACTYAVYCITYGTDF